MVRFNDKPQIQDNALSDTDIMPITDIEDSLSDKKISIGQLKKYLSKNLTNFADIDLVNTDMLADAIIEAPNGIIIANNSNNAIVAKKGLKLLFANGRKQNGKFNNLEYTLQNDVSQAVLSLSNGNYAVFLSYTGSIGYIPIEEIYISSEQPQVSTTNAYWYDIISNYWKYTSTSGATWANTTINILGQVTITNNLLTTVTPNTLAYIPIPETLTIRDLSNITNSGKKRIKDLVQPNIDLAINNTSNTINAKIDSVNSNLQAQVSQNRADINTLNAGEIIAEDITKLRSANELRRSKFAIENDLDIYNILEKEKHSTFDRSKFDVVGSPIITNDGVASGFSSNKYFTTNNFKISNLLNHSWSIYTPILSGVTDSDYGCHPLIISQLGYGSDGTFTVAGASKTISFSINTPDDINPEIRTNHRYLISKTLSSIPSKLQMRTDFNYNTGEYSFYYNVFDGNGWQVAGSYIPETIDKQLFDIVHNNNIEFMFNRRDNSNANDNVLDFKYTKILIDGKKAFSGNKTGIDIIKPDNYEVVGSPVISDDGNIKGLPWKEGSVPTACVSKIVTGISTSQDFEIICPYIYSSSAEAGQLFAVKYLNGEHSRITIYISQTFVQYRFYASDQQWRDVRISNFNWQEKMRYLFKLKVLNGTMYCQYSINNGETWISGGTATGCIQHTTSDKIYIGMVEEVVDLNGFKVYMNGDLVYQPCLKIPYTESKTGSKIVDANYRDRAQDMYEQFGYTHYYTIGDVPEKYNVQVVGSPTLVGGIASGFGKNKHLISNYTPIINSNSNITIKFNNVLPSSIPYNHWFLSTGNTFTGSNLQLLRNVNTSKIELHLGNVNTSSDLALALNKSYDFEIEFQSGKCNVRVKISEDSIYTTYISNYQIPSGFNSNGALVIGALAGNALFYNYGSIDLSQFSITVDGKEVFRGYEPAIPNAYTLQTVSNETIVDMYESEDGIWEQRADLTLRQRGISCTSGTPVTLLKEFRDDKYSLSIGYSSKSASSFTPSASGDWFAEGKVYLQ